MDEHILQFNFCNSITYFSDNQLCDLPEGTAYKIPKKKVYFVCCTPCSGNSILATYSYISTSIIILKSLTSRVYF